MKIPPQAKCVFKGIIFDVYQWEQEMFDGSTQTFEMLKRPDTVQVIPVTGDKILINRQRQPDHPDEYLSLFGGRVDDGEEPLECAKRELLEEAGLESAVWELYKSYEPYHKMEWHVHYFIARDCKKVAEPALDAGEKIENMELGFEQFVEIVTGKELNEGEFTSDILRLKLENKLDELKNKLWG